MIFDDGDWNSFGQNRHHEYIEQRQEIYDATSSLLRLLFKFGVLGQSKFISFRGGQDPYLDANAMNVYIDKHWKL